MKLTAKTIAGIRLPAGKTDHIEWDDDLPGFGLRLRGSGDRCARPGSRSTAPTAAPAG